MKKIDYNNFWYIKDNPITKAGVYPYLGKQISDELEPEKVYYVLRPAEEIEKAKDTFKLIPLIDNHTMLGADYTPAEEKGVHGVLGEDVKAENGTLYADVKIFSEYLKDQIANGKKELSCGYFCKYDLTSGEYEGQHYDAIQRDLRGNHIALVNNGRMGHDVRVMDSMFACDSMDIKNDFLCQSAQEQHNGEDKMDKREIVREIMAISAKPVEAFAGGEAEKVETIAKLAEKIAYPSETGTNDVETVEAEQPIEKVEEAPKVEIEVEKTEDACAKDLDEKEAELAKVAPVVEEEKETEKVADEVLEAEKVEEKEEAMDSIPEKYLKMIAERDSIYESVRGLVGAFDHSLMSATQVAETACKKLNIALDGLDAKAVLKGYLSASKKEELVTLATDSNDTKIDVGFEKYLKGDK